MTVKYLENGGVIFEMNPPCKVYSCVNCPYRRGTWCYYHHLSKRGDFE